LQAAKAAGNLHHCGPVPDLRLRVGVVLHARWFEVMIIVLVSMELIMAITEAGVDHGFLCLHHEAGQRLSAIQAEKYFVCESKEGPHTKYVLECFEMVGKGIFVVMAVEMVLKLFVGQREFFSNPWHIADLAIVFVSGLCKFVLCRFMDTPTKQEEYAGLLLFLRSWRIFKIVRMINEEKEFAEEELQENENERVEVKARELCAELGVAVPAALDQREA